MAGNVAKKTPVVSPEDKPAQPPASESPVLSTPVALPVPPVAVGDVAVKNQEKETKESTPTSTSVKESDVIALTPTTYTKTDICVRQLRHGVGDYGVQGKLLAMGCPQNEHISLFRMQKGAGWGYSGSDPGQQEIGCVGRRRSGDKESDGTKRKILRITMKKVAVKKEVSLSTAKSEPSPTATSVPILPAAALSKSPT